MTVSLMLLGEALNARKALQYAKPKVGRPCSEPTRLHQVKPQNRSRTNQHFAYLHFPGGLFVGPPPPQVSEWGGGGGEGTYLMLSTCNCAGFA